MSEMCQKVRNGFGTPAEWTPRIVDQIFKGKDDIRNCSCYRAVKLLQHSTNVVERMLEKSLCRIVSVDEMQFGFMPERNN